MTITERIFEAVKDMPEVHAAQVLDFAEYLKAKRQGPAEPLAPEESQALCAQLQALVESQPPQAESAGDFIRRTRDEARY